MTDTELRTLCHHFFDAIERGDYAAVAQIYAPEFRLWVNLTGTESTAEDNLEVLRNGAKLHLERCYAPEAVVWHSHDCLYQSRASNLETLKGGMTNLKKMRFKNRRVHTFEGGFVQQHTLFVTHPDDFFGQMDVCFVAFVRDSMISRA